MVFVWYSVFVSYCSREDKHCTIELQSSSLSYFELADEPEIIDVSMRV